MRLDCYKDREGNIIPSSGASKKTVKLMYETLPGRIAGKLVCNKYFAELERAFLDSPFSTLAIDPFIKKNKITMKDYKPNKYFSFNDFFTRESKKGKREPAKGSSVLASPSDGRVSVYKIDDNSVFEIKGSKYTVFSLTRSEELKDYYKDGWFVLIRLCVDNYHRYSYAVSGTKSLDKRIEGSLHTVRPVIYDYVPVYKENTRQYCTILTDRGDQILQMEVGALGVGKITNHHKGIRRVKKGEEKGYFEFGGSSIVLLLPKDSYVPDEDLIKNTGEGYETMVRMGERIGKLNG